MCFCMCEEKVVGVKKKIVGVLVIFSGRLESNEGMSWHKWQLCFL